MDDPRPYESLPAFYQKKRDLLTSSLRQSRFNVLPSQGTFFLLAEYKAISDKSELDFVRWLTATHRVGAITVSAFYAPPTNARSNNQLIRLCFAKEDATLVPPATRLQAIQPPSTPTDK